MIYAIFRTIGLITGYPAQLLLFKRRTFYEDKKSTHLLRGGKLIISNHYNMLDYVMTCFLVFPRRLNAVASEDPFKRPLFRFGMKFFTASIQANRETRSMRFVDRAAEVIRSGQLVQIFPEGMERYDGQVGPFFQSYLVIAHRGNAPIIPIVTDGNYGFGKRTHILIGNEIDVRDYIKTESPIIPREELAAANEAIHARFLELKADLDARIQAEQAEKAAKKNKNNKITKISKSKFS